jgi:hypothetical protein
VRQVGYLQEFNRDARSAKHKMLCQLMRRIIFRRVSKLDGLFHIKCLLTILVRHT